MCATVPEKMNRQYMYVLQASSTVTGVANAKSD